MTFAYSPSWKYTPAFLTQTDALIAQLAIILGLSDAAMELVIAVLRDPFFSINDLTIIEGDLSRVCLVDNSPASYDINQGMCTVDVCVVSISMLNYPLANGIPIEGWTHDPNDEALLDLLPVLDSLRFTSDVRRVLGLRGY